MFQSTIVQKFILGKLKDKLHLLFDLENSAIDGFTIRNLGIKADLLQELSQIIKVPLVLTSGSIESVSLNLPWEKLLSAKKDQAIAVVISGIKINARLPNDLQKPYILLRKKKLIQKFTQQFNKKATSRLTFINKLKQYFFGTFCVEVRNLQLEINIQMKHSLIASLAVQYIKFQKDTKSDRTRFEVRDLVLGYRLSKETKIENIINKADIVLTGTKSPQIDSDNLETNNLQISFNNENFNDILRIITLIKWHNSFIDIPKQLWPHKPSIIGEISPKKKLVYIANIIKYRTLESSARNIRRVLAQRREYIRAFQGLRKDPNDVGPKLRVNALDEELEVWRAKEYRRFCLQWAKMFPNQPHSLMPVKKQPSETKVGWLSYWFPKSAQSQLKQLQACLDNTPLRINQKHFTLSIQLIKISLSIRSLTGKEPFLNLLSRHNQIQSIKTPILEQRPKQIESQIQYGREMKIFVNRLAVQYDLYLGHHSRHCYLMAEIEEKGQGQGEGQGEGGLVGEDQFQDIQNFVQCHITKEKIDIRIQPLRIRMNDDTLQKLSVFKLQRIHNTFQNAQTIILQQNSFNQTSKPKKPSRELTLSTSITLTVPENMCEKDTEQIQLVLEDIGYCGYEERQELEIRGVRLTAVLAVGEREDGSGMREGDGVGGGSLEAVELARTNVTMRKGIRNSIEQTNWIISPIKVDLASMSHLKQLIRLISKLKPKPKDKKPLYRLKNLRRKQSIGQQFIDACENLNEHLMKSATLSQRTKHQRYILKQKKDKKTNIVIESVKVIFQASELELSMTTLTIFEFPSTKSISLTQQQKQLYLRIYNIKNCLKNINDIGKELQRMLELKTKKQESKGYQGDGEGNFIQLNRLSIYVEIYYQEKIKIGVQVREIGVQVEEGKKVKMDCCVGFAFYQYGKSKSRLRDRQQQQQTVKKQYTIEPVKLEYLHQLKYNKDLKTLKLSSISINIKPTLLTQLATLFDKLNTPEHLRIQLTNSTANSISISTTGNSYREYRTHQVAILRGRGCDIVVFGKKEALDLGAQSGTEEVRLTEKIRLVKKMNTEYCYQIQSNFRITNRQENTIWVRVITNRGMAELRKTLMRDAGLVTFEHLSHAHMDVSQERSIGSIGMVGGSNLKRSTSLNDKFVEREEEEDRNYNRHAVERIDVQMKKVNVIRTMANPNINPFSATNAHKDNDAVLQSPRKSQKSQSSYMNLTTVPASGKKPSSLPASNHEVLLHAIPPEQTIQILLNSQQYYIEILQYNRKGELQQKYQPFKVKQILKDSSQLLIHSYIFNSWGLPDEKEISSSLVMATDVTELPDTNIKIYNVQILSPIVMVNKIPQCLQFRFNKQFVDMLDIIESGGRTIRKRSFQAIPLETIQPFSICRINKMQYKEISQTEIAVDGYSKNFRLDNIVEKIKEKGQRAQSQIDVRIVDLLCLNDGKREIQMAIQIRVLRHVMKITVFPQFIFINFTEIPVCLQIQEENYTYPQININPVNTQSEKGSQRVHYKEYIKMGVERLNNIKILQRIFQEYSSSISIFTGSFDYDVTRHVRYGNKDKFIKSNMYNTYQLTPDPSPNPCPTPKTRQKQILYNGTTKLLLRKLQIDDKPINMLLFIPSLFIINKSDWSFFIKSQGQKLKKIEKYSTEYLLINDTISVQACEEYEEIAYNQWMRIVLTALGTIYYAKEMTASNGYESREYELRKKRLKKVPKLFFRIVMTKHEQGHQILIEQSQYPPVSFINKCKSRIQIKQTTQNILQQMQQGQMAEYASKIPHHSPTFSLSIVQHYEFKYHGEFSLNEQQKILHNKVKVTVEEYKDKKIVILEDYQKEGDRKVVSFIGSQLQLEKMEKFVILVCNIQVSLMTRTNRELSCACLKMLEIQHESKNSKRYIKASLDCLDIFSYNGLQPKYLFYSKQASHTGMSISKKEVLDLFKRKVNNSEQVLTRGLSSSSLHKSSLSHSLQQPFSSPCPSPSPGQGSQIFTIDLVIDYHKYATILQKCTVRISELVVVINANTLIDYVKNYYREVCELSDVLASHESGRAILRELAGVFGDGGPTGGTHGTEADEGKEDLRTNRKNSNINDTLMKKVSHRSNESPHEANPKRKPHHPGHQDANPSPNDLDIFHRSFIIQNFSWQGLKVSIKFQNLENLQYFMNNKQIKYLIKFITWIGDLRPIEFSPTLVQYQQYTLVKLLSLIDLNKLIRQLYQTFLQYPLQQLSHILYFITKFLNLNDLDQPTQQWHTFKRLLGSIFNIGRKIFAYSGAPVMYKVDQQGRLVENKGYGERFVQQNLGNQDILGKILGFRYEEWRYKEETRLNRLVIKAYRLERYSPPSVLLPYDPILSRIQTAINDHCGNKLFREITHSVQLNKETILALTEDWLTLYTADKQQWLVLKPEEVLDLYLERAKGQGNRNRGAFNVVVNGGELQLVLVVSVQRGRDRDREIGAGLGVQRFVFGDLWVGRGEIAVVEGMLAEMRLANVY